MSRKKSSLWGVGKRTVSPLDPIYDGASAAMRFGLQNLPGLGKGDFVEQQRSGGNGKGKKLVEDLALTSAGSSGGPMANIGDAREVRIAPTWSEAIRMIAIAGCLGVVFAAPGDD